jgi:hypothetical protein
MPLDSPEDYDRLGEHLCQIDAPLVAFAAKHGYIARPRLWGGRYPNRRIDQEGVVIRSIIIEMDETPKGQRYDQFFPDIPYTISSATWIDDFEQLKRWHSPFIAFRGVPFSNLLRTLQLHLDHFHSYMSSVTEEYIRACDQISALSPPPPDFLQR